ncbi:MAG TPA: ATP-binding protein [Nitrososphaerales archaeon]|nr:ATP-binding protein [Nitrososphaerales archaeon]
MAGEESDQPPELKEKGVLNFTVDSELLRELGERLIGAPYIALAELVKNSYDADANSVTVDLDMAKEQIVVKDDGIGMGKKEFDQFWMRVGSRQKERDRYSERYKREMTGSKGVGRLSVQYLAGELSLATVHYKDPTLRLTARVNWDEAVKAGDLTQAKVEYAIEKSETFKEGTRIVLTHLKQPWGANEVEGLAEQIWMLTPPFRGRFSAGEDPKLRFDIEFRTQNATYKSIFETKMRAVMDAWEAKLVGKNDQGRAVTSIQFRGESSPVVKEYGIDDCRLIDGSYEIRVYRLKGKLPGGISVDEARSYFNKFGGVHVYDGGFHLYFYGDPKNDWLRIEFDHSHRLSISQLLPKDIRDEGGMSFLPTLSRLYGVVNIDTSREKELKLQITRDRLQEGRALEQLVFLVRWALDFYAYEVAKRESASRGKEGDVRSLKATSLQQVLEKYEDQIDGKVYKNIEREALKVAQEYETKAEIQKNKASSLGPLATAGITTLAAQHEIKRQFSVFEDLLDRLGKVRPADAGSKETLASLQRDLKAFFDRLKQTYNLFSNFDARDLSDRRRLPAKKTIDMIADQLAVLMRGINIKTVRVDQKLLLPRATYAEWSSVFQNVILNAYNAMLDSSWKDIDISSRKSGEFQEILVQDSGIGVDLKDSETLFEPFVRKLELSDEMRSIGYGGTGLGLTIVRLIASRIQCEVSFVAPEKSFSTAFSIRWSESP